MANWFGNSTSLFKGRAPETPQPFEIDCECGQRHSGLRRQQHQRIICRACGTALFILPKDVYPASSETVPSTRGKAFSVDVEVDVIEASESRTTADAATKRRSETGKGSQPKASAAVTPKSRPAAPPQASQPPPKVVTKEKPKPRGRLWTPLRTVSVVMVGIVAVTLFAVVRNQRMEDARRRLADTIEDFNESLKNKDWSIARGQINQIVDCLDILGRDDASARRHRQFQREIKAMTDLAGSSLLDILEESDANHDRDAGEWHDTFDLHHEGKWVVMELPARRRLLPSPADEEGEEDDDAPPRYAYDFELPIAVGENDRFVQIEMNFDALGRLNWEEGESRSVVVGAQLRDLELSENGDRWIVSFDSSTAFLWANIETYEGLGFTFADWNPRERTQVLLNEQAAAMGIASPADPTTDPAASEIAFSAQETRE